METPRTGPAGETVDTPRHRALASASRVAILRLVRAATAGLTTDEVAAATGLHPSTVRAHLDRLARAGLLVRNRASGGTPGRPAWRYRAAAPAPAPAPYRALAAALLQHLGDGDPATAGRVGQGWGRRLAADTAPGTDSVEALLRVLDGLGFAPRLVGDHADDDDPAGDEPAGDEPAGDDRAGDVTGPAGARVHLHTCPFLELVASDAETMCRLHAGMIRGVLAAVGDRRDAVLEPFGAPTACVVHLGAATPPRAATP